MKDLLIIISLQDVRLINLTPTLIQQATWGIKGAGLKSAD
jgi:hypothetical protein